MLMHITMLINKRLFWALMPVVRRIFQYLSRVCLVLANR